MTTKAQHTPGPWYTTTKATDSQGLICSESTGANVAVSYDPKDARLIAAAPELLAALEKAVAMLRPDMAQWPDELAELKAVVAKAHGES